jgi:hypothetical protein
VSLPITISEVHGGFSEAAGTLRLTDEYLIIQVQVTVMGMVKQKPLTVKIAPEALHSANYRRRPFKDRITLRPWKTSLLEAVPGKHEGEVELRVKRAYRDEAEGLVADINDWLASRDGAGL